MRLINTAAASETGVPEFLPKAEREYRAVHVSISAAATVTLQGRSAPDMDWVDMDTFTETGAKVVMLMRQMRVVVAGNTGTVIVEMDA